MWIKTTVSPLYVRVSVIIKKRDKSADDKDVKKKKKHLCTICGKINCYSHYGKDYGGSSKFNKWTIFWSNNSTFGGTCKETKSTILKI